MKSAFRPINSKKKSSRFLFYESLKRGAFESNHSHFVPKQDSS